MGCTQKMQGAKKKDWTFLPWGLVSNCSVQHLNLPRNIKKSQREALLKLKQYHQGGASSLPLPEERTLPFSVPSHLLVFCFGRGWCDIRILQQNHHDLPSSQWNHTTCLCGIFQSMWYNNKMLLMAAHPEIISNTSWCSLSTEMWKVHIPFISSCLKTTAPHLELKQGQWPVQHICVTTSSLSKEKTNGQKPWEYVQSLIQLSGVTHSSSFWGECLKNYKPIS